MRKRGKRLFTFLLILALALLFWQLFFREQAELRMHPLAYTELIEQAAAENGLDPALVFALILTESSFVPDAVSHAGAKGLMQLTDDTFLWVAFLADYPEGEDVFDPAVNIRYGCHLLAYLLKEFGTLSEALAAYNAGMARVKGWLADPAISEDGITLIHEKIPFPETKTYIERILRRTEAYRRLYYESES